jgi:hypothetical protein
LGTFSSGKSSIGPDQVNSAFSSAALRLAPPGNAGQGTMKKTACHNAAATIARAGILR